MSRLIWTALLACGCGSAPATAPRPARASEPSGHALRSAESRDLTRRALSPAELSTATDMQAFIDRYFAEGYPPALAPAPHGRIGSLTWGTWIQPLPRSGALPLGSIREGTTLPLLDAERLGGQGKCRQFVRVHHGVVCVGARSSLDPDSTWMRAARYTAPAPGPMPYHYALSVGAPMLTRPVPEHELVWKLGSRNQPRMRGWNAGHDELAEERPIEPNGPVPEFLQDGGMTPTPWGPPRGVYKKRLPNGTLVAYTRAFEAYGRTWVLTTDLSVVPAEGLKRFRISDFRGVELGQGVELPIAFMRKSARPKWRKSAQGFARTDDSWPLRSWVALTGHDERSAGKHFLETREPGVYIERGDATLVEPAKKAPWEAKGGKWIHVRVMRGTLTLYEGTRAVFATLASPGKEATTPYGRYSVESKHHVTTMSTEDGDPKKSWFADVPFTIYFQRPYAIHASYWHEDFGEKKSGGCVNLSPLDAVRVFDWTSPELPDGWGSVQAYGMGGGTFVFVEG